jgi:hypothetical protein
MKIRNYIVISILMLIIGSCITQFIPETDEDQNLLVVEGIITNQDGGNTIRLSLSMPLGKKAVVRPLKGCVVTVTDDQGETLYFPESSTPGTYRSGSVGVIGRKYTLHVKTNNSITNNYSYESLPLEMKPVPPIDSIYYEKVIIADKTKWSPLKQGCQIYLNTFDPTGNCKYYRWDYNETWEFRLPFAVPVNNTCWISNNASVINIKNTSVISENRINRYPLNFISNETDRLGVKYSILVNQYSLNEDEYEYWEKLQNVIQDVGSLYDIIPSSVPGNIYCVENPGEKVLGYFSVSAKTSKRFFIKDYFSGIVNLYADCISDTIYGGASEVPGLNVTAWILEQTYPPQPPLTVITTTRGCADCTVRGTIVQPDFWNDDNR